MTGPDGALWFTDNGAPGGYFTVGRITTSGVISGYSYTPPNPGAFTLTSLDIASGPDGRLWFTSSDRGSNVIGRVTTTGTFRMFPGDINNPEDITAGPDGALWFTNYDYPTGGNSIGRITTSGSVTTYAGSGIDDALYIAAGPDGAMWFSDDHRIDHKGYAIGRITTDGQVTTYTGDGIGEPFDITAGPDGAMWFNNFVSIEGPANIGRITTDGQVTTYPIDGVTYVYSITSGPDGGAVVHRVRRDRSRTDRLRRGRPDHDQRKRDDL